MIGINDYTAATLGATRTPPAPGRDWPDLSGAVNDVKALKDMLVLVYGYDERDIVTLTDQQATRATIMQAITRHLVEPAARGDILFFYYAGHGSQVRNSLSDEPDKLDESLIPADSRLGAADIRDKELRPLFNEILDRGARLTVVLDNCHSGSGARGLPTGARPRGVKPDLRDVAMRAAGPRPEDRGALVLSAAQDADTAWETTDSEGNTHGAFSWSLMQAMRDSSSSESAAETFLRAQARLRASTPFQEPVMAGIADARSRPFLGARVDRRDDRIVIAVQKVRSDGTVILQGGWANGLSAGSELRIAADRDATTRLKVTSVEGFGRSEARVMPAGRPMPPAIHSGALLEVAGWGTPPGRALRVWMPRASMDAAALAKLAHAMQSEAAKRSVRWISDPTTITPQYVLRMGARGWEILGECRTSSPACPPPQAAVPAADKLRACPTSLIAKLPRGASLFVQFPAPAVLAGNIGIAPTIDGIDPVNDPAQADYILAGRYVERSLRYAWVRPLMRATDRRKSGLPVRTSWESDATILREQVLRLRKIYTWHLLQPPIVARFPYQPVMRCESSGELVANGALVGDETYSVVLKATAPAPLHVQPRYVYIFAIDSYGKSVLLFPKSGSVENRLPLPGSAAPPIIFLGNSSRFEVAQPYGMDTYFLLTTDEPLPNPWILEWDGVRTRSPQTSSALEGWWSLERLVFESVPPRRHKVPVPVSERRTSSSGAEAVTTPRALTGSVP